MAKDYTGAVKADAAVTDFLGLETEQQPAKPARRKAAPAKAQEEGKQPRKYHRGQYVPNPEAPDAGEPMGVSRRLMITAYRKEQLDALAELDNVTFNALVNYALDEYLERRAADLKQAAKDKRDALDKLLKTMEG